MQLQSIYSLSRVSKSNLNVYRKTSAYPTIPTYACIKAIEQVWDWFVDTTACRIFVFFGVYMPFPPKRASAYEVDNFMVIDLTQISYAIPYGDYETVAIPKWVDRDGDEGATRTAEHQEEDSQDNDSEVKLIWVMMYIWFLFFIFNRQSSWEYSQVHCDIHNNIDD